MSLLLDEGCFFTAAQLSSFQDPCHARHCAEYFVCILYPPPPPHHSSGTQKLIVPISQSQKPRLRESKRFDHDRNLSPHHRPTPTQQLVTTSPHRGQLWLSRRGPSLISARLDLLLHLLSSGLGQPFSGRSPRPRPPAHAGLRWRLQRSEREDMRGARPLETLARQPRALTLRR